VKVFDQSEMGFMSLGHQEITRSYSDMRYELNKLCSLRHPYIVRFVGLFTNPHCFVLEWAPLKSLEHIRVRQKQAKIGMCFYSILKILCQVRTTSLPHLFGLTVAFCNSGVCVVIIYYLLLLQC